MKHRDKWKDTNGIHGHSEGIPLSHTLEDKISPFPMINSLIGTYYQGRVDVLCVYRQNRVRSTYNPGVLTIRAELMYCIYRQNRVRSTYNPGVLTKQVLPYRDYVTVISNIYDFTVCICTYDT